METQTAKPLEEGAGVSQVDREGMRPCIWRAAWAEALGHRWSVPCLRRASCPPPLPGSDRTEVTCLQGKPREKRLEEGGLWTSRTGEFRQVSVDRTEMLAHFEQGIKRGMVYALAVRTASEGKPAKGRAEQSRLERKPGRPTNRPEANLYSRRRAQGGWPRTEGARDFSLAI